MAAVAVPNRKIAPSIAALEAELRDAEEASAKAGAALEDAGRRLAHARTLTDPNLRAQMTGPAPDDVAVWEAIRDRPGLEQSVASARLEAAKASRQADAALRAAREARLAQLAPEERAAVRELAVRLTAAREAVDRLREVEDRMEAARGGSVHRWSAPWAVIGSGTSMFTPALDSWRDDLRKAGYDIDG